MRWGVVRNSDRPGGADGIDERTGEKVKRTKLGQKLDSLKRERQWNKVLSEMDKLSTKDINAVSRRVGLENSLKSLSKEKFATEKDKQDYLRRASMDDIELARKVTRLNAKRTLYKNVKDASKEQREFGLKIAKIGSSLGYKYAVKRSLDLGDIWDAVENPKFPSDDAKKDIQKLALEKIKKASNKK